MGAGSIPCLYIAVAGIHVKKEIRRAAMIKKYESYKKPNCSCDNTITYLYILYYYVGTQIKFVPFILSLCV